MTATVLLVWCLGSVVIAPLVGRAIRVSRQGSQSAFDAAAAADQIVEVA